MLSTTSWRTPACRAAAGDHHQLLQLLGQARLGAEVGPQRFESLRHLGHVQQERVGTDVGPVRAAQHEGIVSWFLLLGDLVACDERNTGHEFS
jgi:hypothetical protein